MIANESIRTEQLRLGHKALRMLEVCACGADKWSGFAFCHRCLNLLPHPLRMRLYEVNDTLKYHDSYMEAKQWLSSNIGIKMM